MAFVIITRVVCSCNVIRQLLIMNKSQLVLLLLMYHYHSQNDYDFYKILYNENVASSTFCVYEFALYLYMQGFFYSIRNHGSMIIQISMMVWFGHNHGRGVSGAGAINPPAPLTPNTLPLEPSNQVWQHDSRIQTINESMLKYVYLLFQYTIANE